MRITFVSPSLYIAGGIRVVLELSAELVRLGHQVTVVTSDRIIRKVNSPRAALKRSLRNTAHYLSYALTGTPRAESWIPTGATVLKVPDLSAGFIPRGDVVIATSWQTAEWVAAYPSSKGRKFYLVQHYEAWSGPKQRVDATYRLPLQQIVVSSWLKDLMQRTFQQAAHGPLIPGVRSQQFFSPARALHEPRTLGMMVSHFAWKGLADGIAALQLVAEKHPNIRLVLFGSPAETTEFAFPAPGVFYHQPPQEQLRHIYSSCDVWICPSRSEGGPPLPSQEAAACGCAIVTTDVGAAHDVFVPEHSALFSPPNDPQALATNILRLLDDEDLLCQLARNAYREIRRFTWKESATQLVEYLR